MCFTCFLLTHRCVTSTDVLRESARSEFENNRNIENTEEIARLLYIGNDALSQAMQKASEKAQNIDSSKES